MSALPDAVRGLFRASVVARLTTRDALDAFRDALRMELDRGRRYERRFAVLAATLVAPLGTEERARLNSALTRVVRSSDSFCIAERRLYLLLPEADAVAAGRLFERVRDLVPDAVDDLSVAIATFPDDGVTMGSLLALLRRADLARRRRMSRIDGSLDPAPAAVATSRVERAG